MVLLSCERRLTMKDMFSPNDLLLDQTMLCEASRLLEGCPHGKAFVDYLDRYELKTEILSLQNE